MERLQGCRSVDALTISDTDLTSLGGLQSRERAGSLLIEENAKLDSLAGLENLIHVEKLDLQFNPRLRSLAGLGGLADADIVAIDGHAALQSLAGLENLKRVGVLHVRHNDALTSFSALRGLEDVDVAVEIGDNTALESLVGLENLKHVGWVSIQRNSQLQTLNGLQGLETADHVNVEANSGLESLAGLERLKVVGHLWIMYNFKLKSLEGVENLSSTRRMLGLWGNTELRSLAGFQSLETVGGLSVVLNSKLETLDGLERLTRVEGELLLRENFELVSLTGLQSLETVGTFFMEDCRALQFLTGLENLARVGLIEFAYTHLRSLAPLRGLRHAWRGVLIKWCREPLSLEGLEGLQSSASLVVMGCPLEHLGAPFASGASVGVVYIDEESWPRCITLSERLALASLALDVDGSTIPSVTRWDPACGENFGTFACTKGQPCKFSLVGEKTNYTSVFVSGLSAGCHACPRPRPRGNVSEGGSVDFGYVLRDAEAGLHSICSCATGTMPVAQLLLRGPWPSSITTCSRGRNCSIRLEGEGLEPTDRVVLMSSCSGDPRNGFLASWTGKGVYLLHDMATWYAATPAFYQACWRAPCSAAPDGLTCPAPEDSYIHVGEVQLLGTYSRNYTPVLGEEFSVPNIGLGVSDGDQMRLRRTCGEANEDGTDALAAMSSELVFDFGTLREAGIYRLCWCQERDGSKCNDERHFMADAGVVQIRCPAGQELVDSRRCRRCPAGKQGLKPGLHGCSECAVGRFSAGGNETCEACPNGKVAPLMGSGVCFPCPRWRSADAAATGCPPDPARLLLLLALCLAAGGLCTLLVHSTNRRLLVVDVSLREGHTIVTTHTSHGLANFGRTSFPVTFRGAGHPGLDSPSVPFRARVKDTLHLELLKDGSEPVDRLRLDTSMGTLRVDFPSDLCHQGLVVVGLPALVTAVASLGSLVLLAGMITELLVWVPTTALACTVATAATRYLPVDTPLDRRLTEFAQQKLELQLQREILRPPKGPDRALTIGRLHELLQFFHDFIQDRTAYYLDTNIIQPLTKASDVSYAELVGPGRVEWFVSHFWGTPFEHFCAALRKHAETVCGKREWTSLYYWVCFCSNNQHRIHQELGAGWQESSFYLTLQSGSCRGTCMVLDDQALPLTRIWCIFELLQTVKLERSHGSFQGLLFCTSGGVLNTGSGSAEVAVALAEKVAKMNLETAQASSEYDATMIRDQVKFEMGSFAALNGFICREVRRMLVRAQQGADQQFASVFTQLDHAIEENTRKDLFPDLVSV